MKKKNFFSGLKLNIKFTIVIIITIAITMAVLAGVLFYEQEQGVINEAKTYMGHKTERNMSQIDTCIDSINMSTQFFLADEEMLDVLNAASEGRSLDLDTIVYFKETDVKNLERLVSNNPLLYSVRIYASNDNVSEVMPVLYSCSEGTASSQRKTSYSVFTMLGKYVPSSSKNTPFQCTLSPLNTYLAVA